MARIKKKGTTGNAKNYISRSQALRKLQVSLPDFRRLCIFKGIYPREPRSKKKISSSSTASTTFYYARDIQYLLHEPLLSKFREQKTIAKKISKALGRNEVGNAVRLERHLIPRLQLDHIIKERYPTFVDALRDMDDALSLLFLFANLPSAESVPPKVIAKCQRLTMEFEHYIIRTHALRKSFLSIKGIYYQATIQGQDVLWLVPYRFVQAVGEDVDFRIMATFVEFYLTLLGFVNFRLYTSIGLVYPPRFDTQSEELGAELSAIELQEQSSASKQHMSSSLEPNSSGKAQTEVDRLLSQSENEKTAEPSTMTALEKRGHHGDEFISERSLDQFTALDPTADSLLQPPLISNVIAAAQLFESLTIFLSREAPRHPLEFLLRSFGCKRIAWDTTIGHPGAFCAESDPRITHQVVDRPNIPTASVENGPDVERKCGDDIEKANLRVPGRVYVQPQWVWDSVNAGQLQRANVYAPGATLPPHLSPWMRPRAGEYDPTKSLASQESLTEVNDEDSDEQTSTHLDMAGTEIQKNVLNSPITVQQKNNESSQDLMVSPVDHGDMEIQLATSEDEGGVTGNKGHMADDDWLGFSADEADPFDVDSETKDHQADLEAEARGQSLLDRNRDAKSVARRNLRTGRAHADREAQENVERRKMMMPRRKRKMYEKMVYSNQQKDSEVERLRGKRRRLENQLNLQKT